MKNTMWWIKERDNPQLGTYYVACGQMSKKSAKGAEDCLYGYNTMHSYKTESEYMSRLEELKGEGKKVSL